ncbi:hypothetical protein C8Q70DRAFT_150979 [Cubamyces menziesii]|nr:hypothetical protein C8Q70DRAFT_150979 [Cubamyces menziesii]
MSLFRVAANLNACQHRSGSCCPRRRFYLLLEGLVHFTQCSTLVPPGPETLRTLSRAMDTDFVHTQTQILHHIVAAALRLASEKGITALDVFVDLQFSVDVISALESAVRDGVKLRSLRDEAEYRPEIGSELLDMQAQRVQQSVSDVTALQAMTRGSYQLAATSDTFLRSVVDDLSRTIANNLHATRQLAEDGCACPSLDICQPAFVASLADCLRRVVHSHITQGTRTALYRLQGQIDVVTEQNKSLSAAVKVKETLLSELRTKLAHQSELTRTAEEDAQVAGAKVAELELLQQIQQEAISKLKEKQQAMKKDYESLRKQLARISQELNTAQDKLLSAIVTTRRTIQRVSRGTASKNRISISKTTSRK